MPNYSRLSAAASRIEIALTRAARSRPIPDYSSFQTLMARRLERERSEQMTKVHANFSPFTTAAMTLLARYQNRIIGGSKSQMDWRRYKLLQSLYSDNGRGRQVVQVMLEGTLPDDPTADTEDTSPAMLRMRLIAAIQTRNFADASFLLGRLDEADHDEGERAYFHTLVSFSSDKLERTIEWAARVPPHAIDRPRAAWLAAKAAALLGDSAALDRLLSEIGNRLTPCAWLHLIELPDPTEKGIELAVLEKRLPPALLISPTDPAYAEWARHHTQMMARIEARDREVLDASAATGKMPTEDEIAADPVFQRYVGVFLVERKLRASDEASDPARWLIPLISGGDVDAFRTAVERLFEAGDRTGVVALAKRFPSSPGLPWKRDLAVVTIVHAAAALTVDKMAKRLERLLSREKLEPINSNTRRVIVAARLTPMGRISFLASAAELDRVADAGDNWRDCGLISLGLFRALEVELNARLVRPLAARLDVSKLLLQLPEVDGTKTFRRTLNELAGTSGSGHGMMLGALRTLLKSMRSRPDDDPETAAVRDAVRSGFEAVLSDAGRRAAALDMITAMISSAAVGRFRNPPAHGRFLRLAEAAPALIHVEDALDNLARWLPSTR